MLVVNINVSLLNKVIIRGKFKNIMFMVSFLYFYRLDINFKTVKKYGSFYSQLYTDKGKQDKVKIVDVTKRPSKV